MRNYEELSRIYDRKFLNYIISRSKKLTSRWNIEYEDLIQEGILKLVEVYYRNESVEDPFVMTSLVNLYNDINERQEHSFYTVSLEDLYNI